MQTRKITIAALIALAGAAGADAQSWNSATTGSWNDPANWDPATVPNGVGVPATILSTITGGPLSSSGTITFNAPVTLGALTLDLGIAGPTLTLATQLLTLDNGGGSDIVVFSDCAYPVTISGQIVLQGNLVSEWRASNGAITADISGNYGVIHDARPGARLRLYGNNTYTGPTIVRDGWISIRENGNLGDATSGTTVEAAGVLIVESQANPTISGEALTIENGGAMYGLSGEWADEITMVGSALFTPWFDDNEFTVSGKLTGNATFVRESARSRNTVDDSLESILTVSNLANDYTGGTIVRSGVLSIPGDGALGAAGTTVTFNQTGFYEGPGAIATTDDTEIARSVVLTTDGWLRASAATTGTWSGVISGSRPMQIGFLDWTGAVALAGENTYTGGTTVRAGALLAMNTTGSATGPGNVGVAAGATVGGTGSIAGDVVLSGATVAPGASAGTLTVGGLSMDAASTMAIEIGGSGDGEFDRLVSTGAVALAGTIDASLIGGHELQEGDEFEIVSAPSITGTFDAQNLGEHLELEVTSTTVVLRAVNVQAPCPADLNGDSMVDGADLGLLLGAWGAGPNAADLNGDGVIDGADLGLLLGAWGACS